MQLRGFLLILALALPAAISSPTSSSHDLAVRSNEESGSGSGSGVDASASASPEFGSEASSEHKSSSGGAEALEQSEDKEHHDQGEHSVSYSNSEDLKHLNFLLTIAHLSSTFHSTALLSKYTPADFADAGFPDWVRLRYLQILSHEQTHVEFLDKSVMGSGGRAVGACGGVEDNGYIFPDKSVKEFVEVSEVIAGLVVGAVNGVVARITDREYAGVLVSMLGVEARHSAWICSAVKHANGWGTAFETPLTPNEAWSIAQNFFSPECKAKYASLIHSPESHGGEENKEETSESILPSDLHGYPPLMLPNVVVPGQEMEVQWYREFKHAEEHEHDHEEETSYELVAGFKLGTGTYLQPVRVVEEEFEHGKEGGSDYDGHGEDKGQVGGSGSGSGSGSGGPSGSRVASADEMGRGKSMKRKRHLTTPPKELEGKGIVYVVILRSESSQGHAEGASRSGSGSGCGEGGESAEPKDERDMVLAGPAVVTFPYDASGDGL